MKKVSHKKVWGADYKQSHVEPPPIPIVKETSTGNLYGDYVKLKLRRVVRTFISLGCLYLTMASQRSLCFFCENF